MVEIARYIKQNIQSIVNDRIWRAHPFGGYCNLNQAERRASWRSYYHEHRGKILEYQSRFRHENKQHVSERRRQWRLRNLDRIHECERAQLRASRQKNPERFRRKHKRYYSRHREEILARWRMLRPSHTSRVKFQVIRGYSSEMKCERCGFNDIRALSIDHINQRNPNEPRISGDTFYRQLIKKNYPPGFQVLCMNCQFIKRHENREWNTKERKILRDTFKATEPHSSLELSERPILE